MAEMKCPVTGLTRKVVTEIDTSNEFNLNILRENSELSNPMSKNFNYKEEFNKLDLQEVKKDLYEVMLNSQSWWPADYGTYGPFFIRMAWHSAGTYRIGDGRGGAGRGIQRFTPLDSWPDNINLDKARRLIWPIKKKYGNKISWADLIVLAGNCALESMGLEPIGFAGGREDVWETQIDIYWGNEEKMLSDNEINEDDFENPLAAVQMGLIYVNPEGPMGNPDPKLSAVDVRETFTRMAMNDEETVVLIAGGHTFGKCHGAASPNYVGPPPDKAPLEEMGLGWKNSYGTGNGDDTISSGIEGAWKAEPIQWTMGYLKTLFKYQWELIKSPAGSYQWLAKDVDEEDMVVDAHNPAIKHRPMMTTADISLLHDPVYKKIARNYLDNPEKFKSDFAKAWFKLTHRDMGPIGRYLGKEIPKEHFIWQDPVPERKYKLINKKDISELKRRILSSGLSVSELVSIAWASASTFRGSDRRGGANGGRIALEPQKSWEVNEPEKLGKILFVLKVIQERFNDSHSKDKKVSLADIIVLAGSVGIEEGARKAGVNISVPFTPGRTDALQEETDVVSFSVLEPLVDGFRNFEKKKYSVKPEKMLIDKAQLLTLTPPEMTVLLGGLRVLNINYKNSHEGVLTNREGYLTNDFFVNLLDMSTVWKAVDKDEYKYEGRDRETNELKWTASRVDLVFCSNSELRALCEVYACDDNKEKFIVDFVAVWTKIMDNDRYDIK